MNFDEANRVLNELYRLCPKIEFFEWNHEYRLEKLLRKNPELYGLRCLEMKNLLFLPKRNIRYHRYLDAPYKYYSLQIHHGNIIRKYSGWTAKALFEKYAGCGICGHSHRGDNFLKRNTQGIWGWYENMCMCNLNPEYQDFVDWIQGFSVAYFTKKDLFHLEQIPIIEHKFLFNGKLFMN